MKSRYTIAPAILLLYCVACSEPEEIITSDYATDEIEKIETMYREGVTKFEGRTYEPKIETLLPSDKIAAYYMKAANNADKYLKNKTPYNASGRIVYGGYDVGVIPKDASCPTGFDQIEIYMDCEDNNPMTNFVPTYPTNPGTLPSSPYVDGYKNFRWRFCRVDGRKFKTFSRQGGVQNAYAVLKLGTLKPPVPTGAVYTLVRFFDNEDKNNKNSSIGEYAPNWVDGNTTLHFYVFETLQNTFVNGPFVTGLPLDALGGYSYGVLSGHYETEQGWSSTYYEFNATTDDEDKKNANWAQVNGANYSNRWDFMQTSNNTFMRFVFYP
jgi:hypothetical protein